MTVKRHKKPHMLAKNGIVNSFQSIKKPADRAAWAGALQKAGINKSSAEKIAAQMKKTGWTSQSYYKAILSVADGNRKYCKGLKDGALTPCESQIIFAKKPPIKRSGAPTKPINSDKPLKPAKPTQLGNLPPKLTAEQIKARDEKAAAKKTKKIERENSIAIYNENAKLNDIVADIRAKNSKSIGFRSNPFAELRSPYETVRPQKFLTLDPAKSVPKAKVGPASNADPTIGVTKAIVGPSSDYTSAAVQQREAINESMETQKKIDAIRKDCKDAPEKRCDVFEKDIAVSTATYNRDNDPSNGVNDVKRTEIEQFRRNAKVFSARTQRENGAIEKFRKTPRQTQAVIKDLQANGILKTYPEFKIGGGQTKSAEKPVVTSSVRGLTSFSQMSARKNLFADWKSPNDIKFN